MSSKKIIITVFLFITFVTSAFSAHLSWQKVAADGYVIHYGNASGKYDVTIDVGNVSEYNVQDLSSEKTYYFSLTAYDTWGNESGYSPEVTYAALDSKAPELERVEASESHEVTLVFSEMLDAVSAEAVSHYVIFPSVAISKAELQDDGKTVILTTGVQASGNYLVTVSGVRDVSGNEIAPNTALAYRMETTGVESEFSGPTEFSLGQNYPNPFNPSTTIEYSVKESGHVRLAIFNLRGEVVRVLVDQEVSAGQQVPVYWDGRNVYGQQVASGMYFYRLESSGDIQTRRMQLVR
jgi:hypothetical protein